ncbi:MAG TPA: response regulator [Patescibacteria group bacterium]|nr:response regulator [Patescibacteria group bacterium]
MTKSILIVDDDVRNIFALSAVLRSEGFTCVSAMDGLQVMRVLSDNSTIGLILMDIMMPVMDGYETIAALKKHTMYGRIPVIAVTAKAMKGDKEKCLEAGAIAYLSKPVDTNELFKLIKEYTVQWK